MAHMVGYRWDQYIFRVWYLHSVRPVYAGNAALLPMMACDSISQVSSDPRWKAKHTQFPLSTSTRIRNGSLCRWPPLNTVVQLIVTLAVIRLLLVVNAQEVSYCWTLSAPHIPVNVGSRLLNGNQASWGLCFDVFHFKGDGIGPTCISVHTQP